jgi:hypothetical protein
VSLKVVERGWNADEHARTCRCHKKGDFEQGAKLSYRCQQIRQWKALGFQAVAFKPSRNLNVQFTRPQKAT